MSTHTKIKLDSYLSSHTQKINLKWIKDLNIRLKFSKFMTKNTGEKSHDIGFANDFLDMTPKA
jgi:hypothetical protein